MTWDTEKILWYIQDTFICNRIFYFVAYNNICEYAAYKRLMRIYMHLAFIL